MRRTPSRRSPLLDGLQGTAKTRVFSDIVPAQVVERERPKDLEGVSDVIVGKSRQRERPSPLMVALVATAAEHDGASRIPFVQATLPQFLPVDDVVLI
jgi:hypothetical protein